MKSLVPVVLAIALWAPVAAVAQHGSQQVFAEEDWQVRAVTFDDGGKGCVAEVVVGPDSFSIWNFPDGTRRLQFYSDNWSFGEGNFADLVFAVDRVEPWNLTEAELYLNSVLFDLPEGDGSQRLLDEVSSGSQLALTVGNEHKRSYSLNGAGPSLDALSVCAATWQ